MKIQEHKPNGVSERELTQQEIEKLATEGNPEAKKEIAKQEMQTADTDTKKLNVILKFLGLE